MFLSHPLLGASWLQYPLVELGDSNITVYSLLKISLWLTAVLVGNYLLRRLLVDRVLAHTGFEPGLRYAISHIFGYIFVILGCYVALVASGVNLSSLAVIAGALGVGIGFGLQNIVANFVSGLVLLAERPVAIGDRIEVSGVAGRVTNIALRSTTVVTNDNIAIIVPNNELVTKPVTNWSHGDPKVRIRLPVGVAYGTDPEKVQQVLLGVATDHPDVLRDPAPAVFFDSFGESALHFELAVWTTKRAQNPRRFRSELNFAIEKALRLNRVEIPFPQRVVHLRNPTL